jgi:hypothetical protein
MLYFARKLRRKTKMFEVLGDSLQRGEVSMCYTPPTLIIVHCDLVQHFIEDTVLQLII